MDPQEALRRFAAGYAAARAAGNDVDEIDYLHQAVLAASDLFAWLARGGFAPDWAQYRQSATH